MKIRYTLRGRADLEEVYGYLERRTPAAAQSLKLQIERQIG
jgi:plasmid stabilization system protein ParE